MKRPLFPLGNTLATPGALEVLRESGESPWKFLKRHAQGDWGEVCQADWRANVEALEQGERLLSAYTTKLGRRIWIISEADRSATTILLPEEY
jgi:hypothetical protein